MVRLHFKILSSQAIDANYDRMYEWHCLFREINFLGSLFVLVSSYHRFGGVFADHFSSSFSL